MKLTAESTSVLTTVDGVPVRVWNARTESGAPVQLLVHRVGVERGSPAEAELVADLAEQNAPSFSAEGLSASLQLAGALARIARLESEVAESNGAIADVTRRLGEQLPEVDRDADALTLVQRIQDGWGATIVEAAFYRTQCARLATPDVYCTEDGDTVLRPGVDDFAPTFIQPGECCEVRGFTDHGPAWIARIPVPAGAETDDDATTQVYRTEAETRAALVRAREVAS